MKNVRLPFGLAAGLAFALVCGAAAQQQVTYDETIWVGGKDGGTVTFYDFRSDRSNPEFEQPQTGGVLLGMVDNLLDADGKPKMGNRPYLNHGIRFWFRDNSGTTSTPNQYNPDVTVNGTARKYLDRFRPIYMYRSSRTSQDYSVYPPYRLQQTGGTNGWNGYNGEWDGVVNTGSDVPYAYANSSVTVNGQNITTTTGVPMNGRPAEYYPITNAYENRVSEDSLSFDLVYDYRGNADGTYEFVRDKNPRRVYNSRGQQITRAGEQFNGGTNAYPRRGLTPADDWIYDGTNGGRLNYSFTMELKWDFKYERNKGNFEFFGDDDVWAFIGPKGKPEEAVKVMEIGGRHDQTPGSFNLDSLSSPGGPLASFLTEGTQATMYLFYCERHSSGANIKITTNIITSVPQRLWLEVDGQTLTAGEPFPATGIVEDNADNHNRIRNDDGTLKSGQPAGVFTWSACEVRDSDTYTCLPDNASYNQPAMGAQNANGSKPATGDIKIWSQDNKSMNKSDYINLSANKAYSYVLLRGEYVETINGVLVTVRDSVILYVKPGPVAAVYIEGSGTQPSNTDAALRNPAPLAEIVLTSTQTSAENFYAILRDAYGNWVGPAAHGVGGSSNTWSTARAAIATAANGTNTTRGQGKATRVLQKGADTTKILLSHKASTANGGGTFTAESVIKLMDIDYTAIQIGVKVNGVFTPIPGDSILVYIPSDSTLYVQLQRSDNGRWEEASANWSAERVTGPGTAPTGIPSGPSYTYSPADEVKIRLIARVPNNCNTVFCADTLIIEAKYNLPVSMLFFTKDGQPTDLNRVLPDNKYPPADKDTQYVYPTAAAITAVAGETVDIVAALFATRPPALNSYLAWGGSTLDLGGVSWSVVDNDDATRTYARPKGNTNTYEGVFRSTVAHKLHTVLAAYTDDKGATVTQELRIYVLPGAIAGVYIEPESPYGADKNRPLTFNGTLPVYGADNVITRVDDTLSFASTQFTKSAYALLRDKWGNYIAPSGGSVNEPYWPTYVENPNKPIKPTGWWSDKESVVTAEPGFSVSLGQGVITVGSDGEGKTTIWAADSTFLNFIDYSWLNPAKLAVEVLPYAYTALRVVEYDSTGKNFKIYGPDSTLIITTNDEPTLTVQGRRSNCASAHPDSCWEVVKSNPTWDRDTGLTVSLQPPTPGSQWTLDPRKPGEGDITVSTEGLDGPISANVPTIIKLGPPLEARLVILTPENERKAGEPIKAEIQYRNRTGWMEEWDDSWNSTNDRAIFADDKGALNGFLPTVGSKSKGDPKNLCLTGTCTSPNALLLPKNGRDTVTFILFNAQDNPHTLTYTETIAGKLTASATLTLLPGDLAKITIFVDGKDPDTTTVNIPHGDNVVLQTIGEDKYGNPIGPESSKWCADGDIPESNARCEALTPAIVYETGGATESGCGTITATAAGGISDEIKVCITDVSRKPRTIITRDYHGCGYINALEMRFAGVIQPMKNKFDATKDNAKLNIRYPHKGNSVKFSVDSIGGVNGKDSVVILYLNEAFTRKTTADMSTGWKPNVDIDSGLIPDVSFRDIEAVDGAAPVISTAKYFFDKNTGDPKLASIVVTFSEPVTNEGVPWSSTNISGVEPKELFEIWTSENGLSKVRAKKLSKSAKAADADTKEYVRLRDALDGIDKTDYKNDSTMEFVLKNGMELGPPNHYINILATGLRKEHNGKGDEVSEIWDKVSNAPDSLNRKAPITYGNEPPEKMVPVPNPASPDKSEVGNSGKAKNPATGKSAGSDYYKYIGAYHNPDAIKWIKDGGGGAVFEVPIYIARSNGDNGPPDKIKCQVKVYDLAGNLVSSGAEENILGSDIVRDDRADLSKNGATFTKMHMYWSGYNSKGMKAAPGTYRIVVQLSYPGSKDPLAKNKKFTGTVGIAK